MKKLCKIGIYDGYAWILRDWEPMFARDEPKEEAAPAPFTWNGCVELVENNIILPNPNKIIRPNMYPPNSFVPPLYGPDGSLLDRFSLYFELYIKSKVSPQVQLYSHFPLYDAYGNEVKLEQEPKKRVMRWTKPWERESRDLISQWN